MAEKIKYNFLASGEVAPYIIDGDFYIGVDTDIETLERNINLNYVTPRFRIYVLYPDETINYEIPIDYIKVGGSYNENYQSGQRRTLNFTIYNNDQDFTPNINILWAGTRLRLDIGVSFNKDTVWFIKGYFVVTKTSPSLTPNGKEVVVNASDKFSLFEGALGRLEDTYEIPEGTDIQEILQNIQLLELGDGTVRDPKPLFYHESFKGKKTQVAITKNAGETFADLIKDLAMQLSAEYFYSASGNLTFVPTGETITDKDKPVIYSFDADKGELAQLNFDYDYNSIINRVIVVGSSKNGNVYKAIAVNNDERSPLCYQRIGYRTDNIINDSNIFSDILAQERAEYELRQKLILKTTTTSPILFNPFLSVNNLITVDSSFYNLNHEKFLLQSISFGLDFSGQMNITFSNINNLLTNIEVYNAYK